MIRVSAVLLGLPSILALSGGGRKYDKETGAGLPRVEDTEKSAAAALFHERYVAARRHPEYLRLKQVHLENHEGK